MSRRKQRWPGPLSTAELRQFVRNALREGRYRESFHSKAGRTERGITTDDIVHGLAGEWELAAVPEFSAQHGEWKYHVRTRDLDGEELNLVIAVSTARFSLKVVTKW